MNTDRIMSEFKKYYKYKYLTLMFVPVILYYVIFHYGPIYGLQMAFKDFKVSQGIWASSWVGFKHFQRLLEIKSFSQVFTNTLVISFLKLLWGFPSPIVLAILLNELRNMRFKKTVQTISYLPHFISWVILGGIFMQFLSPSIGPVNAVIKAFGFKPVYFLADTEWFRTVLVATSIWKTVGWNSIIYIATLSSIDVSLYEASIVDGANRFQRIIYITLPSLLPVITIMFIFAVGNIINDDFDQVFNLYNPSVYKVADVISTYTYRMGLEQLQYSFATAVGFFKNFTAFVLIITANTITKRINDYGIW